MEYDLLIKNGTIVDGTGNNPFVGDIAIQDGEIKEIGSIESNAKEIIDAEGMTVSPGFVDIHTHLDAQIGWDPEMTPICWHGVTTALIGNCGLTFAPCKPYEVRNDWLRIQLRRLSLPFLQYQPFASFQLQLLAHQKIYRP